MIDEDKTFEIFGYYPSDWASQSNKKVVAVCQNCKKERIVMKFAHSDLCGSCAQTGLRTGNKNGMYNVHRFKKDSPFWNPNLTDEDRKSRKNRKYPEYDDWRIAVFKRDNYTCQKCGNIGINLNAHHLESYANNPELRTTLSNGITLCKKCHKNFHHQYGNNNTKEQYIEYEER